jgi:hypothetical protein
MKRKSDVVRFDSVMKKIAPSDDTTAALQHFAKKGHDLLREKDKLQEELLQIKEDLKALEIPSGVPPGPAKKLVKMLRRAPHAPNRGDLTIRLKKILARGRNTVLGLIAELRRESYVFAKGRDPKKIVRGTLSGKSWCYHAGKFYYLAAAEARKLKTAA